MALSLIITNAISAELEVVLDEFKHAVGVAKHQVLLSLLSSRLNCR